MMRCRRLWLVSASFNIAAGAIAAASVGCAAPESIESSSQDIIGGVANTGDPAVVHISTTAGGEGSGCSGSLISPRVVLTAAHCIDRLGGSIESQSVYFGSTVNGSDDHRVESIDAIDRTIFNSGWTLSGDDIGLILLAHDAVTDPIPFNRTALNSGDVGDPIRLVGWGNTEGGDPGSGSGTKRQVSAPLEGFQNSVVLQYGNSTANTCQGDSGGPGFMNVGGQEVVASITSFGAFGCLGNSGATRVAKYVSFIDNFIASRDQPIAPELTISSPADGAEVKSGFAVRAEASDNTRLDRVELWVNGELQTSGNISPFIFNTPALPDGPATVEVRAYDNRNDETIARRNVTVDSSCKSNSDCGGNLVCGDLGVCEERDGGNIGDACSENAECNSDLCGQDGDTGICTQTCDLAAEDNCPGDFECIDAGGRAVCWPKSGGGCSTGGGSGPAGLLLALLGLLWVRRRPVA